VVVVRCKVRCRPGKTEHVLALLDTAIVPSRALHGVISFDVGRDIHMPQAAIILAVFDDYAARERQESLAEVRRFARLVPGLVDTPPDLQVFDVLACRSSPFVQRRCDDSHS
jgi:quinol monooxygenase YgiN